MLSPAPPRGRRRPPAPAKPEHAGSPRIPAQAAAGAAVPAGSSRPGAPDGGRSKTRAAAGAQTEWPDARLRISAPTRAILDAFHLPDVGTHLLRRAHFAAEELFAREFAAESITPRQKAALVILYQQPGLSQNALADQLRMDRSTVAEMVKRLTAAGLIRRRPAQADQRAYELLLAPPGAALLDRVMPRDLLVEQSVLERLPTEYRPLFLKCLHLLADTPLGMPAPTAT